MGTVYLARHVSLNRQVALKTIDPKKARDSQLIGRFQREIAVSAKLQHEHIVHAYDMGQHEGVHFLVLEYVEGADLHSIVKRDGPLSPGEVAAIGLQTASALVYAHAQGVIHRDIKPHNILLSTDGVAKLLDLGLARSSSDNEDEALTSLTQTSMVLGTADYMPPEQAADMKKVDGRSDTYALSATLYFLLTGRPPFPGGNMMSKMHRLANEEPSPIGQLRPDCPRELTAVIETMLAKRPEARYQSTVEVVRALKPLAVDRIAGRPTMTQAVQTAAEADTTIPASKTVAATPFEFSGEGTVAASMLRRRKQPPLGKWLIGGGIAFSVVAVGVALIYSIMSETNSNKRRSSPAVEIPVAAEVSPLAVRDKLPGHYIAKGENTWAWSPNAMYLATGGGDGRVYVWNVETKEPIQCYRAHGSPIVGVVWSNDGTHVVSREERDGEIHIWRTSNGLRRSQLITAEITASQCGMAYAPGKDELAYTNQGAVWRWDIESDRRTLISKDPFIGQGQSSSMNYHLRYSPDANFLAGWNDEGTLNVWNLNAGEQVISLPFEILAPHRDVGFPTDGRIVVVSDNKAQFFNAETGKLVETKPFATDLRPLETSTNSTRVALTQDGRRFLLWVMGRPAILFDLETWKVIASSTATIYETSYVGWTTSQDLRKYAVNLNTSRLWIGETGSNLNWFQVPINVILRFNWGSAPLPPPEILGGRYLRAMGTKGCWDLHTGSSIFQFPSIAYVRNDGSVDAVVVNGDMRSARILRYADEHAIRDGRFEVIAELKDADGFLIYLKWTADGQRVYGYKSGVHSVCFWNALNGSVVRTVQLAAGMKNLIQANKTGDRFVAPENGQGLSGIVQFGIFNDGLQTGTIKIARDRPTVYSPGVAVSPIGNRLAAGFWNTDDYDLAMWDLKSGKLLWESEMDDVAHNGHQWLRFAKSGQFLVFCDIVFDAATGERLWQYPERIRSTARLTGCFFPNEDYIALPIDNQYQIWNWKKNEKVLCLFSLPDEHWAFVDPKENSNGTVLAPRYLRLLHRDKDGKETWLKRQEFKKETGWKNDPERARFVMPFDDAK